MSGSLTASKAINLRSLGNRLDINSFSVSEKKKSVYNEICNKIKPYSAYNKNLKQMSAFKEISAFQMSKQASARILTRHCL